MTDGKPRLVQLTERDAERAGAGLAQAFASDPLFAYMLPDVDARRRLFPWFFATCVRYGCQRGEAWGIVDGPEGALLGTAFWIRLPDSGGTSARLEAAGFGAASAVLGEAAWGRFLAVNRSMDEIQAQVAPPPCLYLVQLGVNPEQQGRGLGGLLLRRFLAAADDAGLAAYLGTSEPTNLGFYRRHGLAVVADEVEPDSGLRFWVLGLGIPALNRAASGVKEKRAGFATRA
jgi:GNAT superfamily N-acetyltransferase